MTTCYSFGAIISTWFANRYGRKPSMLASAIIFLIGSAIQSIVGLGSSPAVGLKLLYFGRFFGGIGVGLMAALVPTYVSECAPRSIRGRCTGSIEVAVGLGNMLSCTYFLIPRGNHYLTSYCTSLGQLRRIYSDPFWRDAVASSYYHSDHPRCSLLCLYAFPARIASLACRERTL